MFRSSRSRSVSNAPPPRKITLSRRPSSMSTRICSPSARARTVASAYPARCRKLARRTASMRAFAGVAFVLPFRSSTLRYTSSRSATLPWNTSSGARSRAASIQRGVPRDPATPDWYHMVGGASRFGLLYLDRRPARRRERLLPFVSPFLRRVLFTVAAAMRFATRALRPRPFADRLIFSYCLSRLLLQDFGIRISFCAGTTHFPSRRASYAFDCSGERGEAAAAAAGGRASAAARSSGRVFRLHRAQQGESGLLGERHRLLYLGVGGLEGGDARHRHGVRVRVQHDRSRIGVGFSEDLAEDEDDELHGRVIVVVQQHLVEARPIELRLRLGLRLGDADVALGLLLRGAHEAALNIGESRMDRSTLAARDGVSRTRCSRTARPSLASVNPCADQVKAGRKPRASLCSPPAPPSKTCSPRAMQSAIEW